MLMKRRIAWRSSPTRMECNTEETKQIAENLRRTVYLLHEHPHLQSERISSALDLMYRDIKHQISIARLSSISRKARRKARTLHKGLYLSKEEAGVTIEEIIDKGSRTPMEVAIELRKKGYEGQWMRPRFIKCIVKRVLQKKQEKERLHSKLRNAGKGLPDRFGRPIKSRAEVMCEMLPDICREMPTDGISGFEDDIQTAIAPMEKVPW